MDDTVTVALEGAARAPPLAAGRGTEFPRPVGVGISSKGSAGHHGSSD